MDSAKHPDQQHQSSSSATAVVDQQLTAGLTTALLVALPLLLLAYFAYRRALAARRNAVLLCGIGHSGKTTVFSQLVHSRALPTVTSMQPNVSGLATAGRPRLKLVDLPGHERLRAQFLDKFKASARAVVFVVDANTVAKELKDCAECLYGLLTDRELAGGVRKALVLCNKQDTEQAKTQAYVKAALERELQTLRTTRAGALAGLAGGSAERPLGREGKQFEFSDAPWPVEFAACSALDDVDCVRQWLCAL